MGLGFLHYSAISLLGTRGFFCIPVGVVFILEVQLTTLVPFSISLVVFFLLPSHICSETSFRGTPEKRISVEFLTLVPFWQISS